MKNLGFIVLTGVLLILTSCGQQADVKTLLSNQDSKEAIFESIVGDHELMTEFLAEMIGNEHAMMMMKGDQGMMKNMMGGSNMMEMMKDGKMMGNMMKMMHEQGMMSEECMQSCMKMMGDKGMIMQGEEAQTDHDAH